MNKINSMSDSEKKVMKIIWENGGSIYFPNLVEDITKQGVQWKIETIRTFIKRLVAKNMLRIERDGQMSHYIATISENEYLQQQAKSFVCNVFDGNVKGLLASLFNQGSLNKKDLEELKQFWDSGKENIDE